MHTPTPHKQWPLTYKELYNRPGDYALYAVMSPKETTRLDVRLDKNGMFTKQEAALIVRAVNSYQAMKEALEAVLEYDGYLKRGMEGGMNDQVATKVTKALALAEGKE